MKKFIVLFVFFMSFYCVKVMANANFNGKWVSQNNNSTLTLLLSQHGDTIAGSYCFIYRGGNRIDCPGNGESNVHGKINGNIANIYFTSSFDNLKGKAKIEVNEDNMKWTLLSFPSADISAPKANVLIRDSKTALSKSKRIKVDGFIITLANRCGDFFTPCNNMFYLGVRDKDNVSLSLKGKTYLDKTNKVIGSEYSNGDMVYRVSYQPLELTIISNKKEVLKKQGQWIN